MTTAVIASQLAAVGLPVHVVIIRGPLLIVGSLFRAALSGLRRSNARWIKFLGN